MAGNTGGAAYALTPGRAPALELPDAELRLDDARPSRATARRSGARWTSAPSRWTAEGRERWSKPAGGYFVASPAHRRRRHGVHRAPSTAASTPWTRPRGRCAGRYRTARPRLRLARAGPRDGDGLRGVDGRLGVRAARRTAACAGATTRATRSARRPSSGAAPGGARRDRLRRLLRRRPLRAGRRDGPAALVVRHDPARSPRAARPQRPQRLAGARAGAAS